MGSSTEQIRDNIDKATSFSPQKARNFPRRKDFWCVRRYVPFFQSLCVRWR